MNWPAPWALGAIEYPVVPPITVKVVSPDKRLLVGTRERPGVFQALMEAAAKTGARIEDIKTAIRTTNSDKARKYGWPDSTIGSLYFVYTFRVLDATTEAILNMGTTSLPPLVKVEFEEK